MPVLALIAPVCAAMSTNLAEAEVLVLHAPNVRQAVLARGAHPAVEVEETAANGWLLRVYATNGCAPRVRACSNLVNYFDLARDSAEVDDLSLDGAKVRGPELERAQRALRKKYCGS